MMHGVLLRSLRLVPYVCYFWTFGCDESISSTRPSADSGPDSYTGTRGLTVLAVESDVALLRVINRRHYDGC
jgi:hypothetical protein